MIEYELKESIFNKVAVNFCDLKCFRLFPDDQQYQEFYKNKYKSIIDNKGLITYMYIGTIAEPCFYCKFDFVLIFNPKENLILFRHFENKSIYNDEEITVQRAESIYELKDLSLTMQCNLIEISFDQFKKVIARYIK